MFHRPGPKLKACMKEHENDDSVLNRVMKAKFELLDKLCQSAKSLHRHDHRDSPSYKVSESEQLA